jgi:hypothetical protein
MADVFVKNIEVPRIPRNKRIYGGNSFNTTNKFEESQVGGQTIHRELGIITELESALVEVSFGEDFTKTPVGLASLKVYRIVAIGGGYNWQDVLHTFPIDEPVSVSGFTLNIHSSEDLPGVIVEYNFTE